MDDPAAGTSIGGQLTSSVLDIIDSLYGAQPAAAVRLSQTWHQQLSLQDQPLRDMPVAPTAARHSVTDAAVSPAGAAEAAQEVNVEDESDGQGPQQLHEGQQDHLQVHQQEEQQDSGVCNQSIPIDSTADAPELYDSSSSAADHALLASMDGMLAERSKLQLELGGYLQQLSSKADDEGQPLVQLSEDYDVLVERMLREGRAQQYRALQGWEGPHRYKLMRTLCRMWSNTSATCSSQ